MRHWLSPHLTLLAEEIKTPSQARRGLTVGTVERVDTFAVIAKSQRKGLRLTNPNLQTKLSMTQTMKLLVSATLSLILTPCRNW